MEYDEAKRVIRDVYDAAVAELGDDLDRLVVELDTAREFAALTGAHQLGDIGTVTVPLTVRHRRVPHPTCHGERLCMCPHCPRCIGYGMAEPAVKVNMQKCQWCRDGNHYRVELE